MKGLVLLTLVSGVHRAQWAFIMGNGKYLSTSLDDVVFFELMMKLDIYLDQLCGRSSIIRPITIK